MRILIAIGVILLFSTSAFGQTVYWERTEKSGRHQGAYFDQEHHEEYVRDALAALTGKAPRPDATRDELAAITMTLLDELRPYGEKQVAMVQPEIPEWFIQGYDELNPATVSHSRYLDVAAEYSLAPEGDIAALYAFWCTYDAEWFSLSRNAAYKAWLSTVLLDYPPHWAGLRGESADDLHSRLVVPLQTPDEPYREIDNWINTFIKQDEAFIKPKVRDALVQELLGRAGMVSDARYSSETAYGGPIPEDLGLTEQEFYLLAALCLEFSSELYELGPETKQMLHFRDYYISAFRYHLKNQADRG